MKAAALLLVAGPNSVSQSEFDKVIDKLTKENYTELVSFFMINVLLII